VVDDHSVARRADCVGVLEEGSAATTAATRASRCTGTASSSTAATTAAAGSRARAAEAAYRGGSLLEEDGGRIELGNAAGRCVDDQRTSLQKNADYLRRWPSVRVTLEGHADSRGTNEYNLALGERRGNAVKDYLVGLGIAAERMVVISKGEEEPLCREETEGCFARNRRGHFIITAK